MSADGDLRDATTWTASAFKRGVDTTKEVRTPKEAREAMDAAETLGMELVGMEVRGAWEGQDGPELVHGATCDPAPGGAAFSGRKWFTFITRDGDRVKCRPLPGHRGARECDNRLRLMFASE